MDKNKHEEKIIEVKWPLNSTYTCLLIGSILSFIGMWLSIGFFPAISTTTIITGLVFIFVGWAKSMNNM